MKKARLLTMNEIIHLPNLVHLVLLRNASAFKQEDSLMASINTNVAATSALATLRLIDSELSRTQDKIATGLEIEKAADNAAYWSISTSMRSELKSLSAVADSIAVAEGIVDTAYKGIESIHKSMTDVRNLIMMGANNTDVDMGYVTMVHGQNLQQRAVSWPKSKLGQLDKSINEILKGIVTTANSASFANVNLLVYTDTSKALSQSKINFVSGYADSKILSTVINRQDVALFDNMFGQTFGTAAQPAHSGILDNWLWWSANGGSAPTNGNALFPTNTYNAPYGQSQIAIKDDTNILLETEFSLTYYAGGTANRKTAYSSLLNSFDGYLSNLTNALATLGAVNTRLDHSLSFNQTLNDTYDKGIGRLVDADMNETSSRLKALQTQQQLGIQTLSIANSSVQGILQLFK